MNDLTDAQLLELEQVARDLAERAGRLIVDERPRGLGVAATKSSATDIVTEMDRRSEQFLQDELARLRPGDGLLGEEGANREGSTGITWVVDPIDGTVNYLYELPAYAVSVAACVGDLADPERLEPVAGAVVNPVTRETFHGRLGGGAHLTTPDGTDRLVASQGTDLSQALLGTGFSYDAEVRKEQIIRVGVLIDQVRDIRRSGSAALDLCSVAAGRLDIYFESGLNPWDRAVGQLLAREAGATVRGLGEDPTHELTIAGPPALITQVMPWLLAADAEEGTRL